MGEDPAAATCRRVAHVGQGARASWRQVVVVAPAITATRRRVAVCKRSRITRHQPSSVSQGQRDSDCLELRFLGEAGPALDTPLDVLSSVATPWDSTVAQWKRLEMLLVNRVRDVCAGSAFTAGPGGPLCPLWTGCNERSFPHRFCEERTFHYIGEQVVASVCWRVVHILGDRRPLGLRAEAPTSPELTNSIVSSRDSRNGAGLPRLRCRQVWFSA